MVDSGHAKMSLLQTGSHPGQNQQGGRRCFFPEGVEREVSGLVKKEIMYSCPHCDSILGFGFFFGGLLTNRP